MREIKHNILIARIGAGTASNLARGKFDELVEAGSRDTLIFNLLGKIGNLCDEIAEKCDEAEVCIKMIEEQENEPTEARL